MEKTILFLHGFFSSGSCDIAQTIREEMKEDAKVISPDLPTDPMKALEMIRSVIDREKPDLIVGNSCGSFYAQMLAPVTGIPALLGNPYFEMSEFLKARTGTHQYKAPRQDGVQTFTIDEALVGEFSKVESEQFSLCNDFCRDRVFGLFGENDPIAHYRDLFGEHYTNRFSFPGAHTPTPDEVRQYYVPLIRQMLELFPKREQRLFRHFKGKKYRLLHSALDSETCQRVVVYQALYGDNLIWVRPERMFFEKTERDGKTIQRFTEIPDEL